MAAEADFCQMSARERAVLQRLLPEPFVGIEKLREQISNCLVRTIDEDCSIELQVLDVEPARVDQRVPVEARMIDSDGVPIHYLLHVVDGMIHELEMYKEDGSLPQASPDPDMLQVIRLSPP